MHKNTLNYQTSFSRRSRVALPVGLAVLLLTLIGAGLKPGGALAQGVLASPNQSAQMTGATYITQWGTSGAGDGQFNGPHDVEVDTFGNVYVIDTNNHRVQKFDTAGSYSTQWGTGGVGDGQFSSPKGIAVEPGGNVVVADTAKSRIQIFSATGTYLSQAGLQELAEGVSVDSQGKTYVARTGAHSIHFMEFGQGIFTWGSFGSGNGEFAFPADVDAHTENRIFVADTQNNRIQVFGSSGNYITQWGTTGSGNGQFTAPSGIAVDAHGYVYVADTLNDRIQVFDGSGGYITQWGVFGSGNGEFNEPRGISVAENGDIFVADTNNNRIQVFENPVEGQITIVKDASPADGSDFGFFTDVIDRLVQKNEWGSAGTGNGQFDMPMGLAVDRTGKVYVADSDNDRIQVFDNSGAYITEWGSSGSGNGQFSTPVAIAVDGAGTVFVVDQGNARIQVFDSDGSYITQWGSSGSDVGQFSAPTGIAVNAIGVVYVVDTDNHRVQVFNSDGSFITQWGSQGSGNGQFHTATGIAVDSAGQVLVTDAYYGLVQIFDPYGTFLDQWDMDIHPVNDFPEPTAIVVDRAGFVYITETGALDSARIYDVDGNFIQQIGSLSQPQGIALDGAGNLFVAETGNNRIKVFSSGVLNLDDAVPDDGDQITDTWKSPILYPGTYIFSEALPGSGVTLTDITCTGAASWSEDLAGGTATVNLAAGEEVICTFQNELQPGSIKIKVDAIPADGTDFSFSANALAGTGPFTLDDAIPDDGDGITDTQVINGLVNGTYIFTQTLPHSGIALTDITCSGAAAWSKNLASGTVGVALQPGEAVLCTFSNDALSSITIIKDANTTDGTDFAFSTSAFSIGTYITEWGGFSSPRGIAVDPASGKVYVTDGFNHNVQIFDRSGTLISQWGSSGSGNGQFSFPTGIAVDSAGNVYVVDANNDRVQVFDSSGAYLHQWGSFGSGNGQFDNPWGIALDAAGTVYVVDKDNDRIQKFDGSGLYLGQWGTLSSPEYIAVNAQGQVYVTRGSTVHVFSSEGNSLATWGSLGTGPSEFNDARGIAIDGAGSVYVADQLNRRIQVFDGDGTYITQWGSLGTGPGEFQNPTAIAVDPTGTIFTTEVGNNRVQVFGNAVFGLDDALPDDGDLITNTMVIADLLPGTYTVTEALPVGDWEVTDIHCSGVASWSFDLAAASLTLDILAGEDALCTFENTFNAPPTADPGGPYAVPEGSASVTLDGSGSSDPDQDDNTLDLTWDLDGDSIFGETGAAANNGDEIGAGPTFDIPVSDGPLVYPIALRATDNRGLTHTMTTTVEILNVAPSVTLSGSAVVDEGSLYTLDISAVSDPGLDTLSACQLHWGDGQSESCLGALDDFSTHIYTDGPLTPTITIDLTDEDGLYTSVHSLTLTVIDIPPAVNLSGNPSVDEGDIYTLYISPVSDVGLDTISACQVHWGDGQSESCLDAMGSSLTHVYADGPLDQTLSIDLTDEDGFYPNLSSLQVSVNNVSPEVAELRWKDPTGEGQTLTLEGEIIDPSPEDTFILTVDWGDGMVETFNYPPGADRFLITHAYVEDGPGGDPSWTYGITLGIADDDGGTDGTLIAVKVNNVAPELQNLNLASINEGETALLTADIVDPGLLDSFSVVIDWGDGFTETQLLPAGTTTLTANHPFPDDDPSGTPSDTYSVTLSITDNDAGTGYAATLLTVNNLAPEVNAGSDIAVLPGTSIDFSGTFTDPGTLDSHTILWNFGDGTVVSGTLMPKHTYTVAGQYTVTLTVIDDDGGVGMDTIIVSAAIYPVYLPIVARP